MTENEQIQQKKRAFNLFLGLLVIFGISVYILLSVENKWWVGIQTLSDDQYKTLGPLKWALASLIGAVLYLLGQIATFYPKINEKPDPENQNDFIKSTYWYITTLLRAPILTVVIMWLLTNLKVGLGKAETGNAFGVAVDFSIFPDFVNIGIAFILGFYGRVARKQLDIIAQYLFTRAWSMAQMGYDIATSAPDVILLKDTYTFKTDPAMDVVWTSNIGTMDADTGTYKAPDDVSAHGKDVVIRAQLRSEPSVTQFKTVKLRLFKVSGNIIAKPKEVISLKLETKFEKIGEEDVKLEEATWVCDDKKGTFNNDSKGANVNFTAPELDGAAEKTVRITATYKDYKAEFEIKIADSK